MVRRKVSQSQLTLLLDCLEADRDLAIGRLAGVPLGHEDVNNRWNGIAEILNAVGDGATKTGSEWKTYWHEKKYKARKRAAEVKTHASGTGGGRGKKPLTELELRIISLIGQVAVYGNQEVSIPFNDPASSSSAAEPVATTAEAAAVEATATPVAGPSSAPVAGSSSAPVAGPLSTLVTVSSADPLYALFPLSIEEPAAAQFIAENSDSDTAMADAPGEGARAPARGRRGRDRQSTRTYMRTVSAGPPQWAQEFENRRLQVDAEAAQALAGIRVELGGLRQVLSTELGGIRQVLGELLVLLQNRQ